MYMQYIHIYQYTYTYVYIYLDPRMTPKFWAGPKKKPAPFFGLQGPFLILEGEPHYSTNQGASEASEAHR